MKRRGFFSALAGLVAAPAALAAAEALPEATPQPPKIVGFGGPPMYAEILDDDLEQRFSMTVTPILQYPDRVPSLKDDPDGYDKYHCITRCVACNERIFREYMYCKYCHAEQPQ